MKVIAFMAVFASIIHHVIGHYPDSASCVLNTRCTTKNYTEMLFVFHRSKICDSNCAGWRCVVDGVKYDIVACDGDINICSNKENTDPKFSKYYTYVTSNMPYSNMLMLKYAVKGLDIDRSELMDGECNAKIGKPNVVSLAKHSVDYKDLYYKKLKESEVAQKQYADEPNDNRKNETFALGTFIGGNFSGSLIVGLLALAAYGVYRCCKKPQIQVNIGANNNIQQNAAAAGPSDAEAELDEELEQKQGKKKMRKSFDPPKIKKKSIHRKKAKRSHID